MRLSAQRRFKRSGFSLIEVVVATGLCTYALCVIACLMPMGLGTVQIANSQIVETEIFNRIWLEVNTIRFYSLPTYYRVKGGVYPDSPSDFNTTGLTYFDKDGGELSPTASPSPAPPAGSVYYVYCALIYPSAPNPPNNLSSTLSSARLGALGPQVDGMGTSSNPIPTGGSTTSTDPGGGSGLNLFQIQIGFHFDPSTLHNPGQTDPRVTSRTFVIAKRDSSNGA